MTPFDSSFSHMRSHHAMSQKVDTMKYHTYSINGSSLSFLQIYSHHSNYTYLVLLSCFAPIRDFSISTAEQTLLFICSNASRAAFLQMSVITSYFDN